MEANVGLYGVFQTGCTSNFAPRSGDSGCSHCLVERILILRMRILRQFGVLLLLVSCLAPAMACMVPNAEMSTQEPACCRMMKSQCGQVRSSSFSPCEVWI
jgi:hypothetical protein